MTKAKNYNQPGTAFTRLIAEEERRERKHKRKNAVRIEKKKRVYLRRLKGKFRQRQRIYAFRLRQIETRRLYEEFRAIVE